MKKCNLLLCGLIAMLFSACTKDELPEIVSQPSDELVSVTAYVAGDHKDTRVNYSEQGDGSYKLSWEETESFSVIRQGYNETFSKTTPGNTFTGALPGGSDIYYAVYPASTSPTNPQQVPYDLSVQKGVLDKNLTYMYASSEDGTNFEFHHSTAILKAVFSGLPAETTISSVVVTTSEANLKGNHDLVNKKLTSDSSSQQITIDFTEAVADDTPVFIYLPPMAADKKALTFHVTTSNGVYTGSLDGEGGKAIEAGYVYNATDVPVAVSKVESYLTFEAEDVGQTMIISNNGNFLNSDITFEYSTPGTEWKTITSTKEIPFVNNKLYLRGTSSVGTSDSSDDNKYLNIQFNDNGIDVTCTGDIRTLIDYENFTTVDTGSVTFKRLFKNCKALTTAPELPATKLAEKCYYQMFFGCSSLATVPELPATTLSANCYKEMFYNCTSLTTAPALPATTLADYCYNSMFFGCSSLATAPALPATTLAQSCYNNMFNSCTSLATAPALPATTLADYCYQRMFESCTSLTTVPELPATTLATNCCNGMFSGCTSLTEAPELRATTLATNCYNSMFLGCTSLATAPALPATTLAASCYYSMFSGCSSLATAPALPATTLAASCYYNMFENCTSLAKAPDELPATTLTTSCYQQMFYGCTSLTEAPKLPATTLAQYCYRSMFSGCSNLSTVTMLATNISASNCLLNWLNGVSGEGTLYKNASMNLKAGNNGIPSGWTVQDYVAN